MKIKTFSPIVISFLVGTAIGFCFSPAAKVPEPQPEQKAEEPRDTQTADDAAGERSANRALRARIRELEEMLAKQGVEVEKMKEEEKVWEEGEEDTGILLCIK